MENINKKDIIDFLFEDVKKNRNFDVLEYIDTKKRYINNFFIEENLDSCVLGISGGVDSTVVLELLLDAAKEMYSPIKRIVGISMPIYTIGATGQHTAVEKAKILFKRHKENPLFKSKVVNLTQAMNGYLGTSKSYNEWSAGQLLSCVRTPALYFEAAVLQQKGYKSLTVGTTNKTEGLIGFYGKASDGMVDLQLISDLYKSEVYEVAEYYNIPSEIKESSPTGDIYNGKNTEELMGFSFKELEIYTGNTSPENLHLLDHVTFNNISKVLETNKHKKKVGFPSRFINVDGLDTPGFITR